jgi:hypothetical protein
MREQEPNVSMMSSFFTKTFSSPMRAAMMCRRAVTVEGRPSGTFAMIMQMKPLMLTIS